jgi:glutamine synthetase adenylyltransferase
MALTRARAFEIKVLKRRERKRLFDEDVTDPTAIVGDARVMREARGAISGRDIWDIKFARRGLVDIEFVAQVWQLIAGPAMTLSSTRTPSRAGKLARRPLIRRCAGADRGRAPRQAHPSAAHRARRAVQSEGDQRFEGAALRAGDAPISQH